MRTAEERQLELVGAAARGVKLKFVFFWKERTPSGGVGPGCLSQFWPARFSLDGVSYRTAEHWMMAQKARLFGDDAALEEILKARTPQAAKSLGRAVRGFSEDRWATARYEIVVEGKLAKFGHDGELRRYLVATGDRVLVEASPVDRVWGIGLAEDDERATTPSRWRGLNLLGFALMEVRELTRNHGWM